MIHLLDDEGAARAALSGVLPADDDSGSPSDAVARIVWGALTEPGDGLAGELISTFGPAEALRRAARDIDARASPTDAEYGRALKRWGPRLSSTVGADGLRLAAAKGIRMLVPDTALWPTPLDDLGPHAPIALWVRGDPALLGSGRTALALVGARAATGYGDHVATDLAGDLAGSGVTIVSGAAYGIDGSAHRGALAVGGPTVAVLAGGADRSYPAGHTGMIEGIAARGAVVAESPCGTAPSRWRFLQRNRIIAALSAATVVVEAGWRSGSLNTAGHAAALARGLGAVPGPVTSATSAGCHRLLREYDAECITSADDARALLGIDASGAAELSGIRSTDDAVRVRDALSARTARTTVEVARRSGMAVADVEAVLGLLTLGGDAERDAQGWRLGSRG